MMLRSKGSDDTLLHGHKLHTQLQSSLHSDPFSLAKYLTTSDTIDILCFYTL